MDIIISGPIYNVKRVTDKNDETFYQFSVMERCGSLTVWPVVKVPIKVLGENKYVKDILRNLAKMSENSAKLKVPVSIYALGQPQVKNFNEEAEELKDKKFGVYTDKGGAIYITIWNQHNIRIVGTGSYKDEVDVDGDFDRNEVTDDDDSEKKSYGKKSSSKAKVDESELSDAELDKIKASSKKDHTPEDDIPF